jgi:hypothetical protein
MAPTSCFNGQVHRLPDAPEAYGAMITRPKAAPAQSRSTDLAGQPTLRFNTICPIDGCSLHCTLGRTAAADASRAPLAQRSVVVCYSVQS